MAQNNVQGPTSGFFESKVVCCRSMGCAMDSAVPFCGVVGVVTSSYPD